MATSLFNPALKEAPAIRRLRTKDRAQLRAFLERDVAVNIFALSWLENFGVESRRQEVFHFSGVVDPQTQQLVAVALVVTEQLIVLDARRPEAVRLLASWYHAQHTTFEHIVARRDLAEAFWHALGEAARHAQCPWPEARLISPQKLYLRTRTQWLEAEEQGAAKGCLENPLRLARSEDLEAVFLASARMHEEETRDDPLITQPIQFRNHVRHRISTGRSYVWFDEHSRLLFKADISAQSRYGVQVSGVYTDPMVRNRGIATVGVEALCRMLFARGWPRVVLYVNATNQAAIKVYERTGFRYQSEYETIFVERATEARA